MKRLHLPAAALGMLAVAALTGCGGGGGGGNSSSPVATSDTSASIASSSPTTPTTTTPTTTTPTTTTTATTTTPTTTTTAQPAVVTGIIENSGGAGVSGYQVIYDQATADIAATTDANGHFTLTVPVADITGSDTLTLRDTLGATAASQSVTPYSGGTVSVTFTLANAAPPPPAPLLP